MNKPTQEYTTYDQAYDHFNKALFAGRLPVCLITLQHKANARGYFSPKRCEARTLVHFHTDEIALNPDTFGERSDKEILGTLVHEMVHLWQEHFGQPGRGRYHNREWADKMLEVGLKPVSLDFPGKMTGQRVTHEIVPAGAFDTTAGHLLASAFHLN